MPSVVLVMIDGLRPETVTPQVCPQLHGLLARGAWSLQAQSVMPSVTLPCHMSLFHSVPPARHGVTSNGWAPMARPLPGLIEVASAAGRRCAFFYNWEPLRDVSRPGSLRYSYFRDNLLAPEGDDDMADRSAAFIAAEQPDFAFVYLGTVDIAGHVHGWMTEAYLAQAGRVDAALGRLLAALPPESVVLVQSDHGGHERSHGTDLPEDMTIPWVLTGPGVRPGLALEGPLSLLDTAPTLARLLGLPPHPEWEGRCVEAALLQGMPGSLQWTG